MENFRVSKDYDIYRVIIKSDSMKKDRICMSADNDLSNIDRKNYEILKQTIALRSVPETTKEIWLTRSVKDYGSTKFHGQGYIWDFAIEAVDIFYANGDDVGILKKELEGIVLPCGNILHTSGDECNIEFLKGPFKEE